MHEMTMVDVVRELDELVSKYKKIAEEQGDTLLCGIAARLAKDYDALAEKIASVHSQEMDRIQRQNDQIDAMLYAFMSKTDIKFTDDFKAKMLPVAAKITEQKPQVVKMPFTAEECKRVADQLEDMRLHMKSQICKTAQEKCAQIMREDKLGTARALLLKIVKWFEGVK